MQKAAELDVRPNIPGEYKIKFKAEALPLKDKIGGYRLLFSHNVELPLSETHGLDRARRSRAVRPVTKRGQTFFVWSPRCSMPSADG
jgi:hypothetical protein